MSPTITLKVAVAKVLAELRDSAYKSPDYFRVPRSGTEDPFFHLRRSQWYKLLLPCAENNYTKPVVSIVLKQPGAERGIRLISYTSAKAYFDNLAAEAMNAMAGPHLSAADGSAGSVAKC